MVTRVVLSLVLLLLGCSCAFAQPLARVSADRVLLTWDDTSLADADYVRLVRAISGDIPTDSWPVEKVRPGEGLEGVVDRLYDFYRMDVGRFARPMPQTVTALIDLIAKANNVSPDHLMAGQALRVPPVPARAKTIADGSAPTRIFDPQTRQTSVASGKRLSLGPATARDATTTRVVLSMDAAMEAGVGTVAPPPVDKFAQVELMQDRCPSPATILMESPYLVAARQQLKQRAAAIEQAAATRKLALVDFDFADGHGARVRSAVEWLLDQMQVPALSKSIDEFDLGGVVAGRQPPAHMITALQDYLQRGAQSGTDAEAGATALWMIRGTSSGSGTLRNVPAQMLQAALSSRLRAKAAVLNLSWGVVSAGKVLPFDISSLLNSGGIVVVAAGNERKPLIADFEPQNAASNRPQFVNVTFGSRDGELYGRSDNPDVGRVDVSALGCGYAFGRLAARDEGTSFAAPIVAAAAWLKHLADGTSGVAMRPLLARASTLLPPKSPTVLAGGVFDPARLIADPGPHYIDSATKQMVALTDVTVVSNDCGKRSTRPERRGSQQIIVYREGMQFMLLRRWEDLRTGSPRIDDPCAVNHLVVTAKVNGKPWGTPTVDEFFKTVAHIAF